MNTIETKSAKLILKRLFSLIRSRGFRPGVGKYLAAISAVEQGYCTTPDSLKLTLRLLWCQSRDELVIFEPVWDEVWDESIRLHKQEEQIQPIPTVTTTNFQSNLKPRIKKSRFARLKDNLLRALTKVQNFFRYWLLDIFKKLSWAFSPKKQHDIEPISMPIEPPREKPSEQPKFDFVPIRAPKVNSIESDRNGELQEDFPISRRYMIYAWRHLRRLVPIGRADVLDVEATVSAVAEWGFYLKPIYRRREINRTHLVLFVDREGSMTPFHRFVRHLVEAAQEDSGIERVDVFYFRNVFDDIVFCDEYLTKYIALKPIENTKAALADCDRDAIVMIISDAGAARGHYSFERFHACTEFLFALRQEVDTIVWLNPVPQERWRNTSAEKIAYFVPMYPLNPEGLNTAIDRARGQINRRQR